MTSSGRIHGEFLRLINGSNNSSSSCTRQRDVLASPVTAGNKHLLLPPPQPLDNAHSLEKEAAKKTKPGVSLLPSAASSHGRAMEDVRFVFTNVFSTLDAFLTNTFKAGAFPRSFLSRTKQQQEICARVFVPTKKLPETEGSLKRCEHNPQFMLQPAGFLMVFF